MTSQESESNDFFIKVYDAVHLENSQILRTTGEFQSKEWFSDIAVIPAEDQKQYYGSDEGACSAPNGSGRPGLNDPTRGFWSGSGL